METVNQNLLNNPEYGRAYLKEALDKNDERVFLQALHNIIDSFIYDESDLSNQVSPLEVLEK